ncbi:MAG: hypothetical protein NC201_04130 [Prevotella sp.]|nr:hypothetical protein [Bacteroides sp.]MCM1366417.1 hypothetical protein [Prevotella sp.]
MANKREIKKYVQALGSSICESMMMAYYNVEGIDKDSVEQAIGKVLGAIGVAKSHSNIFFNKGVKDFGSEKEYLKEKRNFFRTLFTKVVKDFNTEVEAAMKQFNAAIPDSVKKQNISASK